MMVPAHWETLNFEQSYDKSKKVSKIKKKDFETEGKFPIVSQEKALINGYTNDDSLVVNVTKPVVIFGDHTKTIKYVDFNFAVGADGVKIFEPNEIFDSKFYYYFMSSLRLKSLGYARHYRLLKEINVPAPPIEEQREIVAVLDSAFAKIDAALANVRQNIINADELFQSKLTQIFNNPDPAWQTKTLGQVAAFENGDRGKNYPSKSKQIAEGIPFVNAGCLTNESLDREKFAYISQGTFDKLGNGKYRKNDVLFCLRGSLGKFGKIVDDEPGAIASSLVILRPNEQLSVEFLMQYLRSDNCRDMIKKYEGGAAQPNLGASDLKKFEIRLPALSEQKEIANNLRDISSQARLLQKMYQNEESSLLELKKALLQEAFTGKLSTNML